MMNRLIIILALSLSGSFVFGQSVESFMSKVAANHPDIIAAQQLLVANIAESKTGLTPGNPELSAGFFPGNESAGANKVTWGVSQPFDFPTRYARLKALKRSNLALAEMEVELTSIEILESVRSMAIEYISVRKLLEAKEARLLNLNDLEKAYSTLLEKGETTVVEYNKVVVKQVELESEISSIKSEAAMLVSLLDYSSSNNATMLNESVYPVFNIPDIESLLSQFRLSHPAFLIPEMRSETSMVEVNLAKSEGLPSFELGYSSEIVGDERFTGPSLGMSIPLWQNKGKVKSSKAQVMYQQKRAESELLFLESSYGNYYNSYVSVVKNLALVSDALDISNNKELLTKGLQAGELALTDYLVELGSIYELEDLKIDLEKKKYLYLSKLFELNFNELLTKNQ